jgi:RNA polymerase sigma-70 factor (ECF subfamily)
LAENDREALLRDWLRQHGGAVFKVARAYTFTPEDCEDLAQEIVLQVWRSLPRFQGRASSATWAYRVALNTALSWSRNQRPRRRQQSLVVEQVPAVEPDSAAQAEQREIVERLYAAIRQLPKADAALVLLHLDGLSYRDMSEVLGITETNVGVKLNRARQALAALLKDKV